MIKKHESFVYNISDGIVDDINSNKNESIKNTMKKEKLIYPLNHQFINTILLSLIAKLSILKYLQS